MYALFICLTQFIFLIFTAEEERIRKCKGRVFALQDEPEVARVWLPNNDSPGLAMARAFGDFCLKDFGLISVPEMSYRRLTEKDEFIVLATDGVGNLTTIVTNKDFLFTLPFHIHLKFVVCQWQIWDVLSNKEVVDIVAATSRRASAARALVESAVRAWRYKYPTSKVDDCAVVCLFLDTASHKVCSASIAKSKEQPSSAVQVHNGDRGDVSAPTGLARSGTCRENDEGEGEGEGDDTNKNEEEKESKEEEIDPESEIEWSALEGVSRVNTLLNLPRFEPDKEDMMRKQN